MERDSALDYLLSLHGETVYREDGYWWKVDAWMVKQTASIPHGIRYALTLHDKHNTRVFGMDNAHAIKPPKKGKFSGRLVYDHVHRTPVDKGYPYEFVSVEQLLEDFFTKIDEVIAEREKRG
ncbi:hypothetical protein IG612_07965 [Pectobacterium sp. FL60-S17]|uniref:Uncharacterized protein n=1 Tax=Pectobacterium quasiaquaticum TaxID=2774015 RepID=A0A9Q2IAF3_9GAMM|nr:MULTISPECIES: DUF6516 family protein [Pectobacterium]MBE5202546.1 hypothetical protein [Pectobacterium quasiaquaticum]MBE5209615.1 hypothetical protein [Pectobacterium quasiaquaticum]MBE5215202.1 hypothetical protein [Pectobacterium quasiaquaticum]MBE5221984.1 hypothetical protein [Pectobacterium quasiaquaticum]MBE5224630.1 hypothetical protein [Pectobacterium quasiaquaticum]